MTSPTTTPTTSPRLPTPRPAPATGKLPPLLPGQPLLGSLRELRADSPGLLLRATRTYGDVVRIRDLMWSFYFVAAPEGVQRVLQEHNTRYNKQVVDYRMLRHFLGDGLLTSDGEGWLRQRRLIQPAFHRERIAGFAEMMARAAGELVARWEEIAARGEVVDVTREMTWLTQRIVGRALFSVELGAETTTIGDAFTEINALLTELLYNPFPPLFVPSRRNRRLRASERALDAVVRAIIARRRARGTAGEEGDDLLGMLLRARDAETGQGMSDEQVRDEVMTFMLAGHETTANLLSWTWYLLSAHAEPERALHDELRRVLGGRAPTLADLPALPYTRLVLDEALRLYPPAWAISRNAAEEDKIGGYRIPKGAIVLLSPYVTQRHPAYWERPEAFEPERFTPERAAGRPRFAYFPFGGGPRQCIGNTFALMEAQLALATVAQRFQPRLMPGHRVALEPLITLRPRGGLPMRLERVAE